MKLERESMMFTERGQTSYQRKLLADLWRDILGPNAEAKRLLMELQAQSEDAESWIWLAVGNADGSVSVLTGRERWVAEEAERIMQARAT